MAKSVIQLRKKLQEKSAECEFYKRKYMSALFELNKQILENLDVEKTFAYGGFVDDDFTHDTLRAVKKQEDEKGFSSRFMPNVKFKIKGDITKRADVFDISMLSDGLFWALTDTKGSKIFHIPRLIFDYCTYREVSIYEAIPELVPDGMVYDRESDSLVRKS
jgi:hypothetical protein